MRANREQGEHGAENASSCSGPNGEGSCGNWGFNWIKTLCTVHGTDRLLGRDINDL